MKKLLMLLFIAINLNGISQAIFIGPMIHWELNSENKRHINFGLEAT